MKQLLFNLLNTVEPYQVIKLAIGNNEIYVCREDALFPVAVRFIDYEPEMEQSNYFYSYEIENSFAYVSSHKVMLNNNEYLIDTEIVDVKYYDDYFYVVLGCVGGTSTHYIPYSSISYISIYDSNTMATCSKLVINYNKIQYELNKGGN